MSGKEALLDLLEYNSLKGVISYSDFIYEDDKHFLKAPISISEKDDRSEDVITDVGLLSCKCMNGLIDFDFDLTTNKNIHSHYTRKSKDVHLPRAKMNKGKQRPTYQASIDFNNFEPELKNANSLSIFKSLLKSIHGNFLMYIFSPFSLAPHSLI